jgi:phosphatidylinositol alpha-1,6-mannosyltransferase
VLHAIEALFFDGGDELTVDQERRGSVTVVSIDPENDHVAVILRAESRVKRVRIRALDARGLPAFQAERDVTRPILFLTPGCFDKGGISRFNRYQIRALRELTGARVEVLSVLGPGPDAFEDAFDVAFYAGGTRKRDKLGFLARAARAAASLRPQLVIAGHVNLSGLAHTLARSVGARSVLDIYGLEVWSGLRRDAAWGLRAVDHVISDCHFTATYVEAEGHRRRGTVDVVWDCVDLERFRPGAPRAEVLARYGIPDPSTGKNLLSLGRLSQNAAHKGYDRLLAAFARVAPRVPDLRLVYAGRGDLVETLRDEAARLGLTDRVFFTGMVHEDHLADVYRSAHVFSLISDRGVGRGEGIPLTPLEASACGVPILVGNHDGSQEAVMDGNGFVLDPFELDVHAAKIELLARDEPARQAAAEAAIRVARREFSYDGFREKHRRLLEKYGY